MRADAFLVGDCFPVEIPFQVLVNDLYSDHWYMHINKTRIPCGLISDGQLNTACM